MDKLIERFELECHKAPGSCFNKRMESLYLRGRERNPCQAYIYRTESGGYMVNVFPLAGVDSVSREFINRSPVTLVGCKVLGGSSYEEVVKYMAEVEDKGEL